MRKQLVANCDVTGSPPRIRQAVTKRVLDGQERLEPMRTYWMECVQDPAGAILPNGVIGQA
jgi:hypothetical protein